MTDEPTQATAETTEETEDLITMQEAIVLLKTTRTTFYRWLRSGKIKGMKAGRQWRFYREDVERFLKGESPRIGLTADVGPFLAELSERLERSGASALETLPDASPVERAAGMMIRLATAVGASDVHLAPFEGDGVLRYRIDGLLTEIAKVDARLVAALVEQWKVLAGCDINERERMQEGRIVLEAEAQSDFGLERPIDLRVTILPSLRGEALAARVLDSTAICLDLDHHGYDPYNLERLNRALRNPWGVVVCTGPTGSGKTTALYGCFEKLNQTARMLFSVEDPIELSIDGAVQIQVNSASGVTFSRAMKGVMRSDPDVILVGEVRDSETLVAIQRAALTGHLVLTSLHTKDAVSALLRMVDVGADAFAVSESTRLILAQRLTRKLCPDCSVAAEPSDDHLANARDVVTLGGLDWSALPHRYRQPVGCDRCSQTGFRGRTVVAEVLEVTPEIGRSLARGESAEKILEVAVRQGMVPMAAHGFRLAAEGVTSIPEISRVMGLT